MFEGTVSNGVIVPDAGVELPAEGTRVEFHRKPETKLEPITPAVDDGEPKPGWFWEMCKDLIVDDPNSPGDRSIQHDHYASGAPKR